MAAVPLRFVLVWVVTAPAGQGFACLLQNAFLPPPKRGLHPELCSGPFSLLRGLRDTPFSSSLLAYCMPAPSLLCLRR
ncbi:hypothetical protein D5272_14375 [bacterium D16-76]|nr:hypothetical protein [bacterium D16-76]